MPVVSSMPLLGVMFDSQVVRVVVWVGLVGLTVALLVLMRTRWGQSQPLRKCIVLSLLAHLLLGIYTTTVNLVSGAIGPGDGKPLRVSLVTSGPDDPESDNVTHPQAWQQLADSPAENLSKLVNADVSRALAGPPEFDVAEPHRQTSFNSEMPAALAQVPLTPAAAERASAKPAAAIDAPQASRSETPEHAAPTTTDVPSKPTPDVADPSPKRAPFDPPTDPLAPLATATIDSGASPAGIAAINRAAPAAIAGAESADAATTGTTGAAGNSQSTRLTPATVPVGSGAAAAAAGAELGPNIATIGPASIGPATANRAATEDATGGVPSIYQLRVAPDHTRQAVAHGGTRETEAAVVAALRWLATHQSADGRWDGQRLEAGREAAVDGHERRGAGTRADTGITGLALLAFLASGHTHLEGDHHESVRRGLEFLLSVQAADGNLGGNATLYEKMYCHAMASFAMSEAYAMTHDDRLQTPVRRAIGYTLAAQHGTTGGWRYQPGEAGDTSQLGWQFMALKSAELAGVPIPAQTRAGMIRYLGTVSSGKHGGLASYRPGHQVSRTMTAEALVCRQFLGMASSNPAGNEAGNFLLEELPGDREPNFYYWYYATVGMYQLQDEHWQRWNKALQTTLIGSQRQEGEKAGSWDPDPIWGAYGGRAYSTALGALCLEVYYRFLPFYVEAAGRNRQHK